MKLFSVANTCALVPHIVLREASLTFTLDRIDLKAGKKTAAGESYISINPKGYVPALQLDDGTLLTEVAVIIQYLADLKPEAQLAPSPGTRQRWQWLEWQAFIATELHKGMSPLYQPFSTDEFKSSWRAAKLAPRFEFVDRSLEGRPFLMGEQYTTADAYLFYTLRAWQGRGGDLTPWKQLAAHFERVGSRPAVKAALTADAG